MFTGLIESVGRVAESTITPDGQRLRIVAAFAPELSPGESVAVNGVCLTVTAIDGDTMDADVGPETARVTTLGSVRRDQPVNLERSMRADSRFGGHFVQGHVDATAVVAGLRDAGEARWLTIRFPDRLAAFLIAKGSIAIDGISLTIAELRETELDVMIIPFTWEHTNLSSLHIGDHVNVECDMIGKYVARSVRLQAD